MGDRANFILKQQSGDFLCVYGHSAGYQMLARFAGAIARVMNAGREHDESYANRICISELVEDRWTSDLGWGVSINYLPDNEHSIPIVDFRNGTVSLYDSPMGEYGGGEFDPQDFVDPKFTMSLSSFVNKYSKE